MERPPCCCRLDTRAPGCQLLRGDCQGCREVQLAWLYEKWLAAPLKLARHM